jgi:hypothetical protein
MKSRFTLVALLALGLGFTACEDAFNEKDAIEAQKELLNLKHEHNTALAKLQHANKLSQIAFEDSISKAGGTILSSRAYTLRVTDVATNAPLADATVMVTSQGKAITTTTDASGIAIYENLQIYAGSSFLVTKDGYAATSVAASPQMNVSLWNTTDAKNVVKGRVYVETDLTNSLAETVPSGSLVSASVNVPSGTGNYTVYFPTTTDASGNYTLNLPDAPSGASYEMHFPQISAEQKLYINYTEDDASIVFPNVLPRVATLKTYFEFNNWNADYPSGTELTSSFYLKFEADTLGKVAYARIPLFEDYDPSTGKYVTKNDWVTSSGASGEFALEEIWLFASEIAKPEGVSRLAFKANDTINVSIVDYSGNYLTAVTTAPKLVVYTGADGQIINSPNTRGVLDFVRNADGTLVTGAKGKFKKDPELAIVNGVQNGLDYTTNRWVSGVKGGSVHVRNFYYATGSSREKTVY